MSTKVNDFVTQFAKNNKIFTFLKVQFLYTKNFIKAKDYFQSNAFFGFFNSN